MQSQDDNYEFGPQKLKNIKDLSFQDLQIKDIQKQILRIFREQNLKEVKQQISKQKEADKLKKQLLKIKMYSEIILNKNKQHTIIKKIHDSIQKKPSTVFHDLDFLNTVTQMSRQKNLDEEDKIKENIQMVKKWMFVFPNRQLQEDHENKIQQMENLIFYLDDLDIQQISETQQRQIIPKYMVVLKEMEDRYAKKLGNSLQSIDHHQKRLLESFQFF